MVTAFMVDRLRVLATARIGHPRPRLGGKEDELVDSEKDLTIHQDMNSVSVELDQDRFPAYRSRILVAAVASTTLFVIGHFDCVYGLGECARTKEPATHNESIHDSIHSCRG